MGVYSKKSKDGKLRWYIDFYHEGKRIRECTGTSKTLAGKALAARKTDIERDQYDFKPKGGLLFREFAEQWLKEKKAELKLSSFYDYKCIFERYLLPSFGHKRLGKIKEEDIAKFRTSIKDKLSNKRVNNVLIPLKSLLKTAHRRKKINSNPAAFIEMLRVDKTEIKPLSMEEVKQFLERVDSHFKGYFTVAFFTGLRPSEQIALKWDGIDFTRGKISVVDARVMGEEGAPKTVESRRVIDMTPPVKEALQKQAELTFLEGSYVFISKDGSIVDVGNLRKRVWYPTLKEAGLKKRTMYQTKHTFATLMLSAGENPSWIARMMGHASCEMLFKKYSGYIPNLTHQDGMAFMGKFFSGEYDGHYMDTRAKNKDSGLP